MIWAAIRSVARNLAVLTLLGAVVGWAYPPAFLWLQDWFLACFAVTMGALGLVLEPAEFRQVARSPKDVALGVATQFTVMPLLGFAAAWLLRDDPELAIGFIIVGSAPGAMASNVIVFLAGGATAYSVALTTVATFLAPVVTPSLVEWLGGVFLPVPFWPLMRTILLTVVLPLGAGMWLRQRLGGYRPAVVEAAPAVAVAAIVLIIGYAVAANAPLLAEAGLPVFALVVLVNLLGYLLGWVLGGWYRFERARRVALMVEIGMQNAGLGVALALQHFPPQSALPGAVFATWCVLTAALATYWLRRRVRRQG